MSEAQIQKTLRKHRVHADVENLIDELLEQREEARELAQHLLDCARGNDVVRQDLPDWLEDEEDDEEEAVDDDDDGDGWDGR